MRLLCCGEEVVTSMGGEKSADVAKWDSRLMYAMTLCLHHK